MTIKKRNYFRVRAFPNLEDHYDDFIKYNVVALGWPDIGDLTGKSKEEIRDLLVKGYKLLSMKKGDIIVVPHNNKTITFLEVTSTYVYDKTFINVHMAHQVKTKLLKTVSVSDIPHSFKKSIDTMATLTSLRKYAELIEGILHEKESKKSGISTNTFISDNPSKKIIITISEDVDRNDLDMFINSLYI